MNPSFLLHFNLQSLGRTLHPATSLSAPTWADLLGRAFIAAAAAAAGNHLEPHLSATQVPQVQKPTLALLGRLLCSQRHGHHGGLNSESLFQVWEGCKDCGFTHTCCPSMQKVFFYPEIDGWPDSASLSYSCKWLSSTLIFGET